MMRTTALLPLLLLTLSARVVDGNGPCVFYTSGRAFDLAPLGTLVYRDANAWVYAFNPCDTVKAHHIAPFCALAPAPVVQATARECFRLGAIAQRNVTAVPTGVAVTFGGGSACSASGPRTSRLTIECADIAQPVFASMGDAEGTAVCAYEGVVRARAGCPLGCARNEAGAVCGGTARGTCTVAPDGIAGCVCANGALGDACDGVIGAQRVTSASAVGSSLSAATALFAALMAAVLAAGAFALCSSRDGGSRAGDVGGGAIIIGAATRGWTAKHYDFVGAGAGSFGGFAAARACCSIRVLSLVVAFAICGFASIALGVHSAGTPSTLPLFRHAAAPMLPPAGVSFANWVRRGITAAAVNFDPAVPPAFLNEPLPPCTTHSRAVRLLILGDSVSRYMIDNGCMAIGGTQYNWGEGFVYKASASPACACETDDGVVAYLNLYGSKPRGPYYGHVNTGDDPWTDTELRIARGMELFTAQFGEPMAVILRTDLWDLHMLLDKPPLPPPERAEFLQAMAGTMRVALRQIRALAPRALLGTHTIPMITWKNFDDTFTQAQNALRLLSIEEDLFLFDFKLATDPFPPAVVNRDIHHPTPAYCAAFLQILYGSVRRWAQNCSLDAR